MAEAVLDCTPLPRRAAIGERVSFEQLVRRNQGMIVRLALAMLRDRDAANDVAQETFFRAFRHYESFRSEAAFSTWTYRIAVNLCLDAMRSAGARAAGYSTGTYPIAVSLCLEAMRRPGGRVVQPLDNAEAEAAPALRDPEP